jgi:hypothetical protein
MKSERVVGLDSPVLEPDRLKVDQRADVALMVALGGRLAEVSERIAARSCEASRRFPRLLPDVAFPAGVFDYTPRRARSMWVAGVLAGIFRQYPDLVPVDLHEAVRSVIQKPRFHPIVQWVENPDQRIFPT